LKKGAFKTWIQIEKTSFNFFVISKIDTLLRITHYAFAKRIHVLNALKTPKYPRFVRIVVFSLAYRLLCLLPLLGTASSALKFRHPGHTSCCLRVTRVTRKLADYFAVNWSPFATSFPA